MFTDEQLHQSSPNCEWFIHFALACVANKTVSCSKFVNRLIYFVLKKISNLTARLQNGFSNKFFEYQTNVIHKFVSVYL